METMVSLLVISLAVMLLAGAIVTGAKINRAAEERNLLPGSDEAKSLAGAVTVRLEYSYHDEDGNERTAQSTADASLGWNGAGEEGLYFYE